MGSLYRSEEMCLTQLYLQSEAAFACVSELGELGMAQFRDLNPDVNAFQRKFVNEVRRCDEMERKLRFLERELKKDKIPIDDNGENPLAPLPKEMIDLEAKFDKLENDMKEVNVNQEALKRNFLELTELKHILRKTQNFFEEVRVSLFAAKQQIRPPITILLIVGCALQDDFGFNEHEDERALIVQMFPMALVNPWMENYETYEEEALTEIQNQQQTSLKLGFVAGVILREKVPAFERVLWRACRGNVFLRYAEIETPLEDPQTGDAVNKSVFIIFFQGDQLKSRVKKICEGFQGRVYPCPDSPQERHSAIDILAGRIEDIQVVLNQTEDHRRLVLSEVARSIRVWFIKVRKIKAIYHTLNLFNVNIAEKCLIAECWVPTPDLDKVQLALRRGTEMSGSSVPSILQRMETEQTPPTYNRTDMFTEGFQGLVDAFGIADYREVNPAPFTIITFPFLFGVMFGDVGHGFLMFLSAFYMVVNQKKFLAAKSDNEIWEMMFGGRYLILLMGLFSMYSGFLYNECFSRSLNVFGSSWNVTAMNYSTADMKATTLTIDPIVPGVFPGSPYPYGMDPVWQSSLNKITFENSYKMKGAVILGFAQMVFGLCLAFSNHIYFKNYLSLFCEWIPQMIFMWCMVGYLCIVVFYKWVVWSPIDSHSAPSLLIGQINMFMFTPPSKTLFTWLYNGQTVVQLIVVLLALISVPWMLLSKPLILYHRHKQQLKQGTAKYGGVRVAVDETSDEASILNHDELGQTASIDFEVDEIPPKPVQEFEMSEVMIHQIIHTIEYCLNCISHTASYLRLWALSLAHAELSEVLWTMVMHMGLSMKGIVGALMSFAIFWVFAALTVSILLVMEGLSAFLHALRLHWVEFQSKFYHGQGHLFIPFSFDLIVEGKVEE